MIILTLHWFRAVRRPDRAGLRAETEPVQRAERDQPIASAHIEQRLTGPEPGPVEDLITPGIQRLTQHPLPEGPVTAVTRVKEPP